MNLTLNTTKMKYRLLKQGLLALAVAVGSTAMAQSTDATLATLAKDGGVGESIKVIDNKGTVKYLQTNNGITSITSTAPGSATTTTWQLGGALTDATYIDVDGKVFALDGIALVDGTSESASTDATTESDHGTGTGYTFLVRDEATGATKKLLATDLVTGIHQIEDPQATDASANVAITVTGIPAITYGDPAAFKINVYRNGARLLLDTDYLVTDDTVTIQYDATNLPIYAGDVFEIQYIK